MHQRSFWLLFLTAYVGTLISKGGALLPGMAADDYAFAFKGDAAGNLENFVAQGRIVISLLTQAVDSTGLSLTSISFFTSLLAFGSISLAIAAAVSLARSDGRNRTFHYAAVLLAATHPYLTSYFLFRMSAITHALIYLLLFIALLLLNHKGRKTERFLLSLLVLVVCSHANQAILILYAIAAGAWAISHMCDVRARQGQWREATSGVIFVAGTLTLATVIYLATSGILRAILDVSPSETYTPHLQGSAWNTLQSAMSLAYGVVRGDEPIMAFWMKAWMAITIALILFRCALHDWLRASAAIAFIGAGLLATVSPLALSWGGHVPRTFSPAGLCFALAICIAGTGLTSRSSRLFTFALAPLIAGFCAIGSTLFYQQLLLTQWDQRTAASIYSRALELDDSPRLRIAFQWPAHSKQQSMTGEGINESAFLYTWSLPGLFSVATGEDINVLGADKALCRDIPAWPARSSLQKQADGTILVCMIK